MRKKFLGFWRMNKTRSWLVRICFYGLFLLGPCLLSESHAIYVQGKIAASESPAGIDKEASLKQYRTRECAMKWAGIGCSLVWIVWLAAAVVMKLCPTRSLKCTQGISRDQDMAVRTT